MVARSQKRMAVIVIPVYKQELDDLEMVSLAQVRRVLGKYDICFLAPESLDFSYGGGAHGEYVERVPDVYFTGKNSYSRLMLESWLYERFSAYEYMLLYQLDAFVFADRLQEFCALGYDYIGSPMPRWLDDWRECRCSVGNGGFSLRRISSVLRVLAMREKVFVRRPGEWRENRFLQWEDIFFSYCGTLSELDFHVPDFLTALDFGVEMDVGHAYRRMPEWLPFGCHAWYVNGYEHWKPIIERYGYLLPDAACGSQMVAPDYIVARWQRYHPRKLRDLLQGMKLSENRRVSLWGWGRFGRAARRLLEAGGYAVACIYDTGKVHGDCLDGIPMRVPQPERERLFSPIVISTASYEKDISNRLMLYGYQQGKDFYFMSDLIALLWERYPLGRKTGSYGG